MFFCLVDIPCNASTYKSTFELHVLLGPAQMITHTDIQLIEAIEGMGEITNISLWYTCT